MQLSAVCQTTPTANRLKLVTTALEGRFEPLCFLDGEHDDNSQLYRS
jgi:hypothetical protein